MSVSFIRTKRYQFQNTERLEPVEHAGGLLGVSDIRCHQQCTSCEDRSYLARSQIALVQIDRAQAAGLRISAQAEPQPIVDPFITACCICSKSAAKHLAKVALANWRWSLARSRGPIEMFIQSNYGNFIVLCHRSTPSTRARREHPPATLVKTLAQLVSDHHLLGPDALYAPKPTVPSKLSEGSSRA